MGWEPIRYAKSGNVAIAYRVLDRGRRPDLVFVHGFASNVEVETTTNPHLAFLEALAGFSRVINFDRRGSGLSDRLRQPATLEARMDDLSAVLDAAGSERAVLLATVEAAAMALLFAATYPERVLGLALYRPVVKGTWSADYPWAPTPEDWRERMDFDRLVETWGAPDAVAGFVAVVAPSHVDDPSFVDGFATLMRLSASPSAVATIERMAADLDVRDILPAVRCPTTIWSPADERGEAEYIAARIAGARRHEVPGPDVLITLQTATLVPELERFVATLHDTTERETVLATVLFTDIVGSTEKVVELGDARWRDLVERHHALVRRHLDHFRGRELDTAGDGFFAAFDGPIRAIRCAAAIRDSVRDLGLEIRAGLHTGECELVGEKLGGVAVNIGSRIASRAAANEILVSSTVKDLVAGSPLAFEDRATAELKGLPGEWHLFALHGER
jgi:class 3 adenylate cyclase